jgi:curved DNA-binding protein CbpA
VPDELVVAWRSGGRQGVSRLGTVSLGGLFLKTPEPAAAGSTVDLLMRISLGNDVCARAIVCNVQPGKGMGVIFIHMRREDRSRLNQFLNAQLNADKIEMVAAQSQALAMPHTDDILRASEDARIIASTDRAALKPSVLAEVSEEELQHYLTLARTGTLYQILGITSDASKTQVKQGFYLLARKFHPDRHMNRPAWKGPLQQLMGAATEAYEILSDDEERFEYNRRLVSGPRAESYETAEECAKIAAACLRDHNVGGYIFWMRKCVHNAPTVAQYRAALASGLMLNEGQRWEAIQQFEKAIELDPFDTTAYLQFGALYEEMRLPWRARALYRRILELDSTHADAKERLTRLSREEKKQPAPKLGRLRGRNR